MEKELKLTDHETLESLGKTCDMVPLNGPLHPETEHMTNAESLKHFQRRAYLINTARGKLIAPQPHSPVPCCAGENATVDRQSPAR
ncbi:hypothetical protein J9321_27560 [Pseudomonas fluorescens]|nr:hypothetical protein J9321_27560 [Pseudomonas fluorescens]